MRLSAFFTLRQEDATCVPCAGEKCQLAQLATCVRAFSSESTAPAGRAEIPVSRRDENRMAPKKKGKKGGKKAAAADSGGSPDKLTDVPRDPAAWVLEERLARMQVKVAEAEAGHTDMSGRLEQVQDDQKEIFAHLERELARKTDEVAALEARVRLLEEENAMQRSMADGRLASQREAYEAEIARLKRDYDIVEADVEPGFGYPAATGEQATQQYQSQPGAMASVDSYDAKQLLGMIVSSRPNVYHQVRTWLLDDSEAKGQP